MIDGSGPVFTGGTTGDRGLWITNTFSTDVITGGSITFYVSNSVSPLSFTLGAGGSALWSTPTLDASATTIAGFDAYTTTYSGTWTYNATYGAWVADSAPVFEAVLPSCSSLEVYAVRSADVNGTPVTSTRGPVTLTPTTAIIKTTAPACVSLAAASATFDIDTWLWFPPFDPSLGTLQSVDVSGSWGYWQTFVGTNNSTTTIRIRFSNTCDGTMPVPAGSTETYTDTYSFDVRVAPGATYQPPTHTFTQAFNQTLTAGLADWESAATSGLHVVMNSVYSTAYSGGNLFYVVQTKATADACVTYTYSSGGGGPVTVPV